MFRSVSVIIPTYNGLALLKTNLPAVFKLTRSTDEVVIIDDASTDSSVEWLITEFNLQQRTQNENFGVWQSETMPSMPIITVIKNHKNLRFAASCNLAVSLARYSLVLLLNNDVVPSPTLLDSLLPHFDDETVFAVGCHEKEHNQNGISGGKNKLWFERGLFMHARADDFKTGSTAWVSGGSGLFDKTKWIELGGFDVHFYPAYWEDVDLSFRAQKKGWQTLFEANALVDHNHESTNNDVFGQQRLQKVSWRNSRLFTWKHATVSQRLAFLLWLPYHCSKLGW